MYFCKIILGRQADKTQAGRQNSLVNNGAATNM